VEKDLALVEQFLDALWLEKIWPRIRSAPTGAILPCWWSGWPVGSSRWRAQSDDLQALLGERGRGYKATSSARLLSAMRRLFQHLYREKIREDDPSALLASLSSRSGCRKISAKHKLRDYYSHRLLTCRWSYAIKPCLSYCMLPACAFRSWLA
jgi:hypothetical protein